MWSWTGDTPVHGEEESDRQREGVMRNSDSGGGLRVEGKRLRFEGKGKNVGEGRGGEREVSSGRKMTGD